MNLRQRYMALGATDVDSVAQQIADAIKADDFFTAVALMGEVVSPLERTRVEAKVLELGVNPAVLAQILEMLGSGETIEVTGTAPVLGKKSSLLPFVIVGGLLAVAGYYYSKSQKGRRA